jgi:hypothetical protein
LFLLIEATDIGTFSIRLLPVGSGSSPSGTLKSFDQPSR